eukprot:m.93270 g.93270  ORF g.93270 m.93270 type:complete len:608 (+) comp8909_c0_seq1:135-1958(+)
MENDGERENGKDVVEGIYKDAQRVGNIPLEGLSHEDTVCKFCGVSYLIHREVKRLQDRAQYLETQLKEFKDDAAKAREYKSQSEEWKRKAGEADQAMKKSRAALAHLRMVLSDDILMKVTALRQDKKTLQGDVQAFQDMIRGDFILQCPPLLQQISDRTHNLSMMVNELKNTNKLQSIKLKDIPALKGELKSIKEEMEALRQANATAEKCQLQHKEENDILKEAKQLLEKKAFTLQASLASAKRLQEEREVNENNACESIASQLSSAKTELSLQTQKYLELQKLHESLSTSYEQLLSSSSSTKTVLTSTINELQTQIKTLTTTYNNEAVLLKTIQEENEQLLKANAASFEELDASKLLVLELDKKCVSLTSENEAFKTDFASLQERFKLHSQESYSKETTVEELKRVVADLKEEMLNQKKKYEEKLNIFQHELEDYQRKLRSKMEELLDVEEKAFLLEKEKNEMKTKSLQTSRLLDEKIKAQSEQIESLQHRLKLAVTDLHVGSQMEDMKKALEKKQEEIIVLQDTVAKECFERQELVCALEAAREQALQLQKQTGIIRPSSLPSMVSSRQSTTRSSKSSSKEGEYLLGRSRVAHNNKRVSGRGGRK